MARPLLGSTTTSPLLCMIVMLVLTISFAPTTMTQVPCGQTCQNSNQCYGTCTWCNNNVCSRGKPCNSPCSISAECDSTGACVYCRGALCRSDGECGNYCDQDVDCWGKCTICVNNQCVVPCSSFCNSTSDCNYPGSSCPQCINLMCQKGGCGAFCGSVNDCADQGNCVRCYNYQCSSDCGLPCNNDNECNGNYTGCGFCNNGICSPGTCGSLCPANNGCSPPCTYCNNHMCQFGLSCGSACVVDTDCGSSCPYCANSICSAGTVVLK